MIRAIPLALLAGVMIGLTTTAAAHSPYLLPNVFDVGERKYVTVEASFTETFFVPDVAMKADDYHVVSPDGTKHAVAPVYTQDLTILEVPTTARGTYRISTGERRGRISKATFTNGDWEFIEPGKAAPAGAKVYDVQSITMSDVFVSRGAPDEKALTPRNTGLEFKPVTHPNKLFAGKNAQFEVLFGGQPLANQSIDVHFGDERYSEKKLYAQTKTDAAGRFSVKLDRPGVYLAMTRHRMMPAAEGQPATSHTYSVTFEATD